MPQTPLPKPQPETDGVLSFLFLIQQGVTAWQQAGELLVRLKRDNSNIYHEIIKREPSLTVDMLVTIERIGRKELYAPAVLSSSMAMKRALSYGYEDQVKLSNEPVRVVVDVRGGIPIIEERMVRDMSREEMKRAMGPTGVRPVADQASMFQIQPKRGRPIGRTKHDGSLPPVTAAACEPPRPTKAMGLFAVRLNSFGVVIFEKTTARPETTQRVMIGSGTAVIEVCAFI